MDTTHASQQNEAPVIEDSDHHLRFQIPHAHLSRVFGNDWFALKAEAFARVFGTPGFLVAQTLIVGAWIAVNVLGIAKFDIYPFILLNLAFSLQAAYAAPLILLAQTRQADRDKALADADDQATVITNVMTGRPARGVVNRAMREVGPISADAPPFPHAATALGPLKAAAEKLGKVDFTNLWAGQAIRLGREMPAAELTRALAGSALARLSGLAG